MNPTTDVLEKRVAALEGGVAGLATASGQSAAGRSHPATENVTWVNYPGLESHSSHALARQYFHRGQYGAIVGFGIRGGAEAGRKLIGSRSLFSHLENVGDAKSLAIHPASTTHSQLSEAEQAGAGVTPDFVRLSVGIEAYEDLEADLKQALDKV